MVTEIGPRHWMGEQGAVVVVAAEELHSDGPSMTVTGLPSQRTEYWMVGVPIEDNRLMTRPPGFRIYCSLLNIQLANIH